MSDTAVQSSTWETNDLVVAAALKCLGHAATHLRWDDEARSAFFMYEETPLLLASVANLALGRARVEPKQFNNYYVGLKDEMFDFMRGEGVAPPRGR